MTGSRPDDADLDRVAQLLYDRIGLRPEPTLRGRLQRGLRDEATCQGDDVGTYLDSVTDEAAVQRLVNRVTVQESAFFRHPEQFDVLTRTLLPILREPITMWSAACGNGQEAFSLAMILEEAGLDGKVIATDVSTTALARTEAACYSDRELAGLSSERVARHMSPTGGAWRVNRTVRDRVITLPYNLTQPLPERVRSSQLVFCRNVLIYFSAEHARAFLDQLADNLPPDAYLFLGAAESIWPISDRFAAVRLGETFVYRCRPEPAQRSDTPSPTPATSRRRPRGPDPRAPIPARRRPGALQLDLSGSSALLSGAGQDAMAAGDLGAAVVAFRKWLYLMPDDPMAHLHLGLALEAAGDHRAAHRAYRAARHALLATDSTSIEPALEGYTKDLLLRLIDIREQVPLP